MSESTEGRRERITKAIGDVEQLRSRVIHLQGEVDAAVRELRVVQTELQDLLREEHLCPR